MPDTPDFDKIADRIIALHTDICSELGADLSDDVADTRRDLHAALLQQLRLIWNARGAADIAKIEHELATLMGGNAAGPYINNLARALRGLDR